MLVNDRVARIVLGVPHVVGAWTFPLAVIGPLTLLLMFGAPLTGNGLFAVPVCLCLAAYFAYWAYDGYLGIVTKLYRLRGPKAMLGRAAVINGIWGLVTGLLVMALLAYGAVGIVLREITGRWPFP